MDPGRRLGRLRLLSRGERWRLQRVEPIPAQAIPESHEPFVIEQAKRFFARGQAKTAQPLRQTGRSRRLGGERLGLPVVLKRPDSAFSTDVVKAKDEAELKAKLDALLEESDLVIGQAYVPSAYDWRIGLLDGRALYACRYHMAPGHWQVQRPSGSRQRYGNVDTLPAPHRDAPLASTAISPPTTRRGCSATSGSTPEAASPASIAWRSRSAPSTSRSVRRPTGPWWRRSRVWCDT
jgi:hypothetical protein